MRQENKQLRAANRELRAENARVHKRIENLEMTMEEGIAKTVGEAIAKVIAPLQATITEKDKEFAAKKPAWPRFVELIKIIR